MCNTIGRSDNNKNLRSLDNDLLNAEPNVLAHLSKLLQKIEAINQRLQKAKDAFHRNEEVCYFPADSECWFDSVASLEKAQNSRNEWLQAMYSRFLRLRCFSCVENDIEDLHKEYEVFKKAIGQFNFAADALTQREKEIVCSWRSTLWR